MLLLLLPPPQLWYRCRQHCHRQRPHDDYDIVVVVDAVVIHDDFPIKFARRRKRRMREESGIVGRDDDEYWQMPLWREGL